MQPERKAVGEVIGRLKNKWRARDVEVYATNYPDTVYTVGKPFDGSEDVCCFEPRSQWYRMINCFPDTAQYQYE
jgi:hypothetical protein